MSGTQQKIYPAVMILCTAALVTYLMGDLFGVEVLGLSDWQVTALASLNLVSAVIVAATSRLSQGGRR